MHIWPEKHNEWHTTYELQLSLKTMHIWVPFIKSCIRRTTTQNMNICPCRNNFKAKFASYVILVLSCVLFITYYSRHICFTPYDLHIHSRDNIVNFQWQASSKFPLYICVACMSAGTWFIIGLSHYSSPPTKSLGSGAEKAEPPCFSSLEVSGWLKCSEVEVNQLLTLGVILSFMVCFNQ